MRHAALALLAASVFEVGGCLPLHDTRQARCDGPALRATVERYRTDLLTANVDDLADLYNESYQFTTPFGEVEQRSVELNMLASRQLRYDEFTIHGFRQQIDGDTAYVSLNVTARGHHLKAAFAGPHVYTHVFVCRGAHWSLLVSHVSFAPFYKPDKGSMTAPRGRR
jgi:hypothetical protein